MKILPVGAVCSMRTEGQTDNKKLVVAFPNVAKVSRNRINYNGRTYKTTQKALGELPNNIFKLKIWFSYVGLFSKLKLTGLLV